MAGDGSETGVYSCEVRLHHNDLLSETHFFMCSCNSLKVFGKLAASSGAIEPRSMPGNFNDMTRLNSCQQGLHMALVLCTPRRVEAKSGQEQ
jgi:hypothetical protein